MPRIFFSAGEHSGDQHTAAVATALCALRPDVSCEGLGGRRMAAAGVALLENLADRSVMGLAPVLRELPFFLRLMDRVVAHLALVRPDLVVLTDYPGFNLRLAARAKELGLPVVYYVSPQIWAWWPGRVRRIGRVVDEMLVLFPFEEAFYREAGVPCRCVGHPLASYLGNAESRPDGPIEPPPPLGGRVGVGGTGDGSGVPPRRAVRQAAPYAFSDDPAWRADWGLPAPRPLVALLPGSRAHEIEALLPEMLATAAALAALRPDATFAVGLAGDGAQGPGPERTASDPPFSALSPQPSALGTRRPPLRAWAERLLADAGLPVRIVAGRTHELMRAADAALTCSGTATLELLYFGTPMLVLYRVGALAHALAPWLLTTEHIALPNVLAGRRLVPEALFARARPTAWARTLALLLADTATRRAQRAGLAELRRTLFAGDPARRAAEALAARLPPPKNEAATGTPGRRPEGARGVS